MPLPWHMRPRHAGVHLVAAIPDIITQILKWGKPQKIKGCPIVAAPEVVTLFGKEPRTHYVHTSTVACACHDTITKKQNGDHLLEFSLALRSAPALVTLATMLWVPSPSFSRPHGHEARNAMRRSYFSTCTSSARRPRCLSLCAMPGSNRRQHDRRRLSFNNSYVGYGARLNIGFDC